MSCLEKLPKLFLAAILTLVAARSYISEAKTLHGGLVIVPSKRIPAEAMKRGQAMELHLVTPDTLYLYIEQDNGRSVAVFDVSDPHKIKFKKLVEVDAPAPFDFVQSVGQYTLLIRYRGGMGVALIDLSKPQLPHLKDINAPATESYIIPVGADRLGDSTIASNAPASSIPQDYEITDPSGLQPAMIVNGVVQQLIDEGNGTIYLLGANGLTIVRNVKSERKWAASGPVWTNTIDDD
jgi:hypothetical protein